MRKPSYWLAAALLCSATMVIVPSCKDDDDDDNGSSSQTTTVSKPVKGTDFDVNVEGNTVTITTKLTYGNMYVLLDGVQKQIKDGKAVVNIPVSGEYKMTFNIYENGINTASDEFTVKIEATDLSFLDNSTTLKVLTGGKSAYEDGTNDGKGVFTRSWRLDWFKNNSGVSYSKSGFGAGLYYYGYMNSGKTLAVSAGRGSYQGQGDVEHATISFDFVNQVAKLVIEGDDFLGGNGDVVPAGTYYASFQYTQKEQNLFDGVNTSDWDGNDQSTSFGEDNLTAFGDEYTGEYYEITLNKVAIGESGIVRLPVDNFYNSNKENDGGSTPYYSFRDRDRLNFDIFVTNDAIMYAHMHRDNDNNGVSDEKGFEIIYTFVSDELDKAGLYSYEVPAEEVEGEWVSHISFWGSDSWDGEDVADVKTVTVKGNGEYTYTATLKKDVSAEYFCIHFDSGKSYAAFTAEGVTTEVKSIKINGTETSLITTANLELVGADGKNENYRLQFFSGSDWSNFEDGIALKSGDEIEIVVTVSGL